MNRDCSYFEEKPNLNLSSMPRFPETKGMTKEEKFTSVTIYVSKIIDHLQGRESELNHIVIHGTSRVASVLESLEGKEHQ